MMSLCAASGDSGLPEWQVKINCSVLANKSNTWLSDWRLDNQDICTYTTHALTLLRFDNFMCSLFWRIAAKRWQSSAQLSHNTREHHKCLFMWSRDYIDNGWKLTQPHWGPVKEMKEYPDGTSKQPPNKPWGYGWGWLYWYVTWTFFRPHPYYRYMFLLQCPHSPADKSYSQMLPTENRMCWLFSFELI